LAPLPRRRLGKNKETGIVRIQDQALERRSTKPLIIVAAFAALALSLFAVVGPALATHVTPTPINSGNPTCDDFAPEGAEWIELKLQNDQLANGTYSDGTLTVTISNFVNSDSGVPGSFDWSSNIGVDAVFVKAGSDKHNLYVYDPEATSDTGLGPQAGQGNGISHISFCYDVELETESPTPTPSPTPVVTPTPTPEETPQGSTPTPTPEQSVAGGTGTPAPSQPDTAMSPTGGPSPIPTLVFGLILLASLGTLAYANVKTARSRG
jgi:hypothetical protein